MKKITYYFGLFALVSSIVSCDPMKEIYSDLDNGAVDKSGIKDITLELTKTEYDLLRGVEKANTPYSSQYFTSEDSAKVLIPKILEKKYPYLGEKSTAKITYNLGNKNLAVSAPKVFTADDATYVAATGGTTFKNFNSNDQIIKGASHVLPNPKQGDLVRITYLWNPTKTNVTSDVVFVNGVWHVCYTLVAADYTNMEQNFANFSTVDAAKSYIPKFLELKFPYTNVEGTIKTVIYAFSRTVSGSRLTTDELLLLKYTNGKWVIQDGTNKAEMQFAVTKGVWLADNTIKYTLTSDEHKLEVSKYVQDAAAKASITQYGNFDLKLFTTRQMVVEPLAKFTKTKFPNAAVGQRYLLSYKTYNPNATATIWLELGEDGEYFEKLD